MTDQTPREVIKDALDRFQRNFDRMVDPAASEEDRRQSVANSIHFFSFVTLLEEVRRSNPERAKQLNRWIGDMLEDGGCGEIVYQWREELASGREITLPTPLSRLPKDASSSVGDGEAVTDELRVSPEQELWWVLDAATDEFMASDEPCDRTTALARAVLKAGWRPPLPLDKHGVGSISEAIGLALGDAYAGIEFEDPTFERGTDAVIEALREWEQVEQS